MSINHSQFPERIKKIEGQTSKRRSKPIRKSNVENDKAYSDEQFVEKKRHLKNDFGIDTLNLTPEQIANIGFDRMEKLLSHSQTETYEGTLNMREDAILMLNEELNEVAAFEDIPYYSELDRKYP